MADARGFKLELEQFMRRVEDVEIVGLQKRIVAELLGAVVLATPVGDQRRWKANVERAARGLPALPKGYVGGQARRNWQVTIGTPARTVLSGTDQSGQRATADGYAVAARLTKPERMWLSNPLDYMSRLEDGWSRQAPQGIVRNAIAAVSAKYARVR